MSHSLAAARLRADRLEFEMWYVRHPAIVGIREILGARISASDGARNVVTRQSRHHDDIMMPIGRPKNWDATKHNGGRKSWLMCLLSQTTSYLLAGYAFNRSACTIFAKGASNERRAPNLSPC